jgi:hypothetical protein
MVSEGGALVAVDGEVVAVDGEVVAVDGVVIVADTITLSPAFFTAWVNAALGVSGALVDALLDVVPNTTGPLVATELVVLACPPTCVYIAATTPAQTIAAPIAVTIATLGSRSHLTLNIFNTSRYHSVRICALNICRP